VSRSGIILAGTAVLDVVNVIQRWPDEEQIAFIHETIEAPGGPPHNAAAGLIKLAAPFPVTFIGVVGDDAYGDIFVAKAKAYGVDTSRLRRVSGAKTDYTHVMTSIETGKRTFFYSPGVNNTIAADHLLPPDDKGKIFYLGSPGLSPSMDKNDGWRSALRAARERGYKTCMELCPIPAELQRKTVRPCLPLLDYFVINDSEAEAVTQLIVTKQGHLDIKAAEVACRNLLDAGVNDLVAIHHPEGAVAMRKSGETIFAASVNVPKEDIIGSVGAGDAFYAGMLFGLHEDWPLGQCLALANAAAATSLQSTLTSASIRPWTECLNYATDKGLRV
jgi:sugar/nucleoside kinase (ribokinase family)